MNYSILIPTHNRAALLERTIASIAAQHVPPGVEVELIVVANACSDDTVTRCQHAFKALPWPSRVVEEPTPGLNIARRRCVEQSRGEVCLMLDDDVWLDQGWLEGMIKAFGPLGADVVGGRVLLWWEEIAKPDWYQPFMNGLLSSNDRGEKPYTLASATGAIGANLAFRRSVYDAISGFRPGLDRTGSQLLAGGDSDFVDRAIDAGFKAMYIPDASVKHWVPASRLTQSYLTGVAYGNGKSSVLKKPPMSAKRWLRCFVGHTWLLFGHGTVTVCMSMMGRGQRGLNHRCLASVGRGGLAGLWARFRGRRPS